MAKRREKELEYRGLTVGVASATRRQENYDYIVDKIQKLKGRESKPEGQRPDSKRIPVLEKEAAKLRKKMDLRPAL